MHKGAVELNYFCAYNKPLAVPILNGLSWYGYSVQPVESKPKAKTIAPCYALL
jgi:hypothetical protein